MFLLFSIFSDYLKTSVEQKIFPEVKNNDSSKAKEWTLEISYQDNVGRWKFYARHIESWIIQRLEKEENNSNKYLNTDDVRNVFSGMYFASHFPVCEI